MAALTHGINIDLKCFTAETYAQKLGGNLQQVFDSISLFYEAGVHVELTTLVVPDFNTDFTAFRKAAEKIRAVSPEIPWHITRFFPTSRYSAEQPTPLADIDFFINILVELGFYYIYSGNTGEDVHTPCPRCGTLLIERFIFGKTKVRIKNGACPECSTPIQGVFHE
jgi:pyruvate formate lyase activating enzyme